MPKSTNRGGSAPGLHRPLPEETYLGLPDRAALTDYVVERDRQQRVKDDKSMPPKVVTRRKV